MSLFKTRPFDFLIKPINQNHIDGVLGQAFRLLSKEEKFFEYKFRQSYFNVSLEDIIYFQSEGKKIKIILVKEEREFYGTLKEISTQLHDEILLKQMEKGAW